MIVLAVLLLVAVVAVVAFVLVAGVDQHVQLTADWLNLDWRPSVILVFLLGAVCLFVAEIALALLRAGFRRNIHRRRELKRLRQRDNQRAAAPEEPAEGHHEPTAVTEHEPSPHEPIRGGRGAPQSPDDPPRTTQTPTTVADRGSWYDDPPPPHP